MSLSIPPPTKKYHVFAITHRPKDGVTQNDIVVFENYLRRRGQYYKLITEKEGHERHIHCVVCFDPSVFKANVVRDVLKLYPELSEEERIVLRQGVKVVYDSNWLSYLDKGDSTVLISENLPDGCLDSFYPEESSNKTRKNLSYYSRLEKLWYENEGNDKHPTASNCRDFLFDMMYCKRMIDVIRDDKSIIQVSRHLSRYLKKSKVCCIDVNIYERDE